MMKTNGEETAAARTTGIDTSRAEQSHVIITKRHQSDAMETEKDGTTIEVAYRMRYSNTA